MRSISEEEDVIMLSKSDLTNQVAKKADINQTKANQVVNSMLDVITEALSHGEEVRITGFGSFKVVQRQERAGRNPRTGEPITVAGGPRPAFTPGSRLIDSVRGQSRRAA
jgi:DNA-binding protein HU-beta